MKININGYLKDLTNNTLISIETKAIKTKNKLSYTLNNDKHILKIISSNKIILNRTTNDIESTFYFEKNKIIPMLYNIKDKELTMEIDIKTTKIEVTDTNIKVNYTVVDSNNEYEYYIEMSE